MRATQIYYGHRKFFQMALETEAEVEPGKWAPARCCGTRVGFGRIYAAWLVFTGRADVLRWLGQ